MRSASPVSRLLQDAQLAALAPSHSHRPGSLIPCTVHLDDGQAFRSFRPNDHALQTLLSYHSVPPVDRPPRGAMGHLFLDTAERLAEEFCRRPTEDALLSFLLLPKAGLALGSRTPGVRLNDVLSAFPARLLPVPIPLPRPTLPTDDRRARPPRSATDRAQVLIEKGLLGRAARALAEPTSMADNTAETIAELRSKHPVGAPCPFPASANPREGTMPTTDDVTKALDSFAKDTAPGISGWNVPLLRDAVKRPAVLQMLLRLCRMFQLGTLPGKQLLLASRLIALDKPGGGVRPIAVGELLYRLVAKVALSKSYSLSQLAPFQLGVKTAGGVEPIVHLVREAVAGRVQGYTHLCAVDFRNAFNSTKRRAIAMGVLKHAPAFLKLTRWAYNEPSALVMQDGTCIESSEGVRQGDPLGPFLFSLAIRDTLTQLAEKLTRRQHPASPPPLLMAYLDDVYILSAEEVSPTLLTSLLVGAPITINTDKTSSHSLAALRATGLPILGSFVGSEENRRRFLKAKVQGLEETLARLAELPRHHGMALLRSSSSLLLRHLPRTLDPAGMEQQYATIDRLLRDSVQTLAGCTSLPPASQDLVHLPARLGGIGIGSYVDMLRPAFEHAHSNAARVLCGVSLAVSFPVSPWLAPVSLSLTNPLTEEEQAAHTDAATETEQDTEIDFAAGERQDSAGRARARYQRALRCKEKARLARVQQAITPQQEAVRQEGASYLGRVWLSSLPTSRPLLLLDADLASALRIRLLLPRDDPAALCGLCGAASAFAHEDCCRARHRATITKHDFVCRALEKAMRTVPGWTVSRETREEMDSQRRVDLRVDAPTGTVCYDVTLVSVAKESAGVSPQSTLLSAETDKKRKYRSLGRSFKPLVLSQGGMMGQETCKSYRDLQDALSCSAKEWMSVFLSVSLVRFRARTWHGLGLLV